MPPAPFPRPPSTQAKRQNFLCPSDQVLHHADWCSVASSRAAAPPSLSWALLMCRSHAPSLEGPRAAALWEHLTLSPAVCFAARIRSPSTYTAQARHAHQLHAAYATKYPLLPGEVHANPPPSPAHPVSLSPCHESLSVAPNAQQGRSSCGATQTHPGTG